MIRRTYRERLYPTREQAERLQWTLDQCRDLYNTLLRERRAAYAEIGPRNGVNYGFQCHGLLDHKKARPELSGVNSQVLQNVAKRVDLAFQAFFRRVKAGETPGYPRFKGRRRYDSFTIPHPTQGWKLTAGGRGPFPVRPRDEDRIPRPVARRMLAREYGRLALSNIGAIKVRWSRPLEGHIKTVTIKREGVHWYVCFSCEMEVEQAAPSVQPPTAIDVGLEHFATLYDGRHIPNPRWYRRAERVLALRQQRKARRVKGSRNYHRARVLIAKAHRKIRNQRQQFHHETANDLLTQYSAIAVEDLQVNNMVRRPKPKVDERRSLEVGQTVYVPNGASAKSGLNKSINDAGWAQFIFILSYKAEEAGGSIVRLNPSGTSQLCSGCGQTVPKTLAERWHICPHCGLLLQRDHNSARVLYQRAGFGSGGPVLTASGP